MKRSLILIALAAVVQLGCAQDRARYEELVREAFDLFEKEHYTASAARYSAAFAILGGRGKADDRYNAARAWAQGGVPDSAFFNLNRMAERMDYADIEQISRDPALNALHMDERWNGLLALVRANKDRQEALLDHRLAALLDSIHEEDQGLRRRIEEVESRYGRDSQEMRAHWQKMRATDSTNLVVVRRILDERGWLGAEVVGREGNSTLFLVIQHADLETQEQYVTMMRAAVRDRRARGEDLALLEDRILMRNGKRQIYGSQIGRFPDTGESYLSPVEDPDHLDERRASVGLAPIAEYLSWLGMKWDLDAYKAAMPALEQRIKHRKP